MNNTTIEIWKDVVGYDGHYQVSNMGNVKTLRRLRLDGYAHINEKILKPGNLQGYRLVALYKDGICKSLRVHRLVAQAFIDNPHSKAEVNHINAIRCDNRVENLEWATPKENTNHALSLGLKPPQKGITVVNTITNETFPSVGASARHYKINRGNLREMLHGKRNNNTSLVILKNKAA